MSNYIAEQNIETLTDYALKYENKIKRKNRVLFLNKPKKMDFDIIGYTTLKKYSAKADTEVLEFENKLLNIYPNFCEDWRVCGIIPIQGTRKGVAILKRKPNLLYWGIFTIVASRVIYNYIMAALN